MTDSYTTDRPVPAPQTVQHYSTSTNLGLLLGRIVLGAVFIAHGWQKASSGISNTQSRFAGMDIPYADITAILQTGVELIGGALLILGALTRLVGVLLAASMLGAAWLVHRSEFFIENNGYEFVLILAAFALTLALTGAGRFSVDDAFRHRVRS